MGSSLDLILANWFVASKENYRLQTNSKTKPSLYTRYADYIFLLTQNNTNLTNFYHR